MFGKDPEVKPALDKVAGGSYGTIIDAELTRQRDRETSIRQRGISVVTAASGLATLILALGGGAIRPNTTLVTSTAGKWFLGAALVFFGFAAVFGLSVNLPWPSVRTAHGRFSEWVQTLAGCEGVPWRATDLVEAALKAAKQKADLIGTLRRKNDQRNAILAAAILSLAGATIFLGLSVGTSLV